MCVCVCACVIIYALRIWLYIHVYVRVHAGKNLLMITCEFIEFNFGCFTNTLPILLHNRNTMIGFLGGIPAHEYDNHDNPQHKRVV